MTGRGEDLRIALYTRHLGNDAETLACPYSKEESYESFVPTDLGEHVQGPVPSQTIQKSKGTLGTAIASM